MILNSDLQPVLNMTAQSEIPSVTIKSVASLLSYPRTLSFSDGQARLYSSNNNRSYNIRYNSNSSYFNVSTSSSYVYIYKKTDVSTEMTVDEEDPVVEYEQYGAYISGDPMIYNPATDQLSREYSSGMVCFSILDPARLNLPWYQAFDPDIHIIA